MRAKIAYMAEQKCLFCVAKVPILEVKNMGFIKLLSISYLGKGIKTSSASVYLGRMLG